jgi:NAD(P)-dependent dehydrogenase (short-subunit alcohol dehydrogenase family)
MIYKNGTMATINNPEESVKKQYNLSGKNIVITGGAGFLGRIFAEAVAEMGGLPILLDINMDYVEDAISHLSLKNYSADGFSVNITDGESVKYIVSQIVEKYEQIHVLINAAAFAMKNLQEGGTGFFAPFEEYEKNLWQISLDVNLTGTFLITQAVGRVMKAKKYGVIINVASDVAVISPDHRIYQPDNRFNYDGVSFNTPIAYPVTKAGILSFTRYLATYWAKDGIRVNSISPAGVYRNQDEKFIEQLVYRIPLGRMAFPEELKGPIVFLASEASSFMTGGNLIIDGGRTIW